MPRLLSLFLLVLLAAPAPADDLELLIAFSSFRERRLHPKVYFYEHDGVSKGKIVGSIDAINQRSDYRPWLSHDGRYCVFASELENQTGRISFWDRKEKKLIDLPKINDTPNGQLSPALSGDGTLLAFSAWNRPGASTRWNVLLYDIEGKKLLDLPNLNKPGIDTRMSTISGDGRIVAYVSNLKTDKTQRLTDIYLYDR